jgi:hypothetical protein
MAIAFGAASSGVLGSPSTSGTLAHTTSGSDRALVVGVHTTNPSDVITGCTYSGVAMDLVHKIGSSDAGQNYLFYLTAPATGTNNIVCSASTTIFFILSGVSYTGVSQSAQPEAASEETSFFPMTCQVTTVTVDAWTILHATDTGAQLAASTGSTERTDPGGLSRSGLFDSNGGHASPGSKDMSCTGNALGFGTGIMLSIAPAGAAVGQPTMRRWGGVPHVGGRKGFGRSGGGR